MFADSVNVALLLAGLFNLLIGGEFELTTSIVCKVELEGTRGSGFCGTPCTSFFELSIVGITTSCFQDNSINALSSSWAFELKGAVL